MESIIIKVENLTRKFEDFTAVDQISFDVKEGELFGLLGPNGAGKTTTINMLSTLLKPTSGYAEVAGFNIMKNKNEVRNNIGIVFQEPALDNRLTGRENLEFHAMMYGMGKEERRKRIDLILSLVELSDKSNVLVDNYSGGMKRRLEIARGLIHRPKVLFLDEPTLGLDTQTRRHIWDYIKKLNRENDVSIILTTHYMEEADFLCDRVAIVDHGKIVALNTPASLKDVLGGDVVALEIENNTEGMEQLLKTVEWIKTVKRHNGTLSLTMEKGETRIPELVLLAQQKEATITSITLHKPSLEEVFLYFTGGTIREREADQNERNRNRSRRRMGRRG
jgi:ABC-2 type transport system ATP-binding protein